MTNRILRLGTRAILVLGPVAIIGILAAATPAAAEPYIYRPQTLSRSDWALNLGLGVGHVDAAPHDHTGLGLNTEFAVGLMSGVQLGVRTGFRFGHDGRASEADSFGRTLVTETYGVNGDTVANPEVGLRWALANSSSAQLGLDGRLYLPIESGTRVGFLIGLPVALRIGSLARIDTGLFVPVILGPGDTRTVVSFPLHLWFQVDSRLFLGPLTGVRFHSGGSTVPFGFGLGYSVNYDADIKTWVLFPDVSRDGSAKSFGVGVGLEVRL